MNQSTGFQPINMDRSERVVIDTAALPWLESPAAGIARKQLEREAAETGQVTSIVRYNPGTFFPAHQHPAGEEILVLNGVFEDEHGHYPAGSYFRNPPGSSHTPGSSAGCVLLVKLNMFADGDSQAVNIETDKQPWLPGLVDGLEVMPLHSFGHESTALVRWQPGTRFNPHRHFGGEEIYVLDGVFADEHGSYPTGTWLRSPDGSQHHPYTETGCIIFVKTGHLLALMA